ncbi:cobalt-precorrin-6A reductase [Oscillatoria sp. FACHB-1406]|uniref:cobalt-precorrin-6A reductase n=1 Tax=Oscillatoria sp. FACHB-1406 TaxID=2692846 RepID=UPI0016875D8D|nr:cobalt-precorrin-6A reductase [Oscillatoria sp. FACHB-1406]MBD2576122.1 cobalt-precorrin-6A reductase [Oscillatoria sp. FACHB-1406]
MLLVIGGTQESKEIATAIASLRISCTISVATDAARSLYPASPYLQVRVGRMDKSGFAAFLQGEKVIAIIDASHPFAVEVSRNAIAAAAAVGISYLRYERDEERPITNYELRITNYSELLEGNYLAGERVLLAVGCKALPLFQAWQTRSTLFARVLPAVNSLEVALKAGFSSDRIIALRPPVSAELEAALWQQWQISLVVAKASGKAGGEDVKRSVAERLGIPLIIIARPKVAYTQQTSHLEDVIAFCRQFVNP